MNFPEHTFIAFLIGVIIFWGFLGLSLVEGTVCVLLTILAGLSPDCDHQEAKIRRWLNMAVLTLALAIAILQVPLELSFEWAKEAGILFLAIVGVYGLIMMCVFGRHRGPSHSLAFAIFIGAAFYFIAYNEMHALAGIAGTLTHLILDKEIKLI